jgi:hypothetical protein
MTNEAPKLKKLVWNDQLDKILKDRQFECVKLSWIHNRDSHRYSLYNNILFVITTICTSLSATSVITSNSLFISINTSITNFVNLSFGVLLIFSTALSSFQHTMNYTELSSKHKIGAVKYTALSNNIVKLLILDKKAKEQSTEFFTWIETEFTNLQINTPNPTEYSVSAYNLENGHIHYDACDTHTIVIPNKKESIDDIIEIPARLNNDTLMDFEKKRFIQNMYS